MTLKFLKYSLLSLLTFYFVACKDNPETPTIPNYIEGSGVYIVNEGLWGQNNSSISYYNPETGLINGNAYGLANNGKALGDTGNDFVVYDTLAFCVVNTSNKVEIMSAKSLVSVRSVDIGQFSSPRSIYVKSLTEAYVTCFSGEVVKFNPQTGAILKHIPVGVAPEGICRTSTKIFVANTAYAAGNTISMIDPNTDAELSKIKVGTNPVRVIYNSSESNLYVLCSGAYDSIGRGMLYRLNSETGAIKDSVVINGNPYRAVFTTGTNMLVTTNLGVAKVNTATMTLESSLFVKGTDINSFFGSVSSLAYDQVKQLVYVGNPKDYSQAGEVVVLGLDGSIKGRIKVGINPGAIYPYWRL